MNDKLIRATYMVVSSYVWYVVVCALNFWLGLRCLYWLDSEEGWGGFINLPLAIANFAVVILNIVIFRRDRFRRALWKYKKNGL